MLLPYTPLGSLLGFVKPPVTFWAFLATFVGSYLLLAEVLKRWFYSKAIRRLEEASPNQRSHS
jgi:Mg2+-importing ATPase